MTTLLTHSRLACFRTCPRKHFLRYELGIRPEVESGPIRIGRAFHGYLEARDKGLEYVPPLEDPYELAMVAALIEAHGQRWADHPIEAVASELRFELPITNPETGAASKLWRLAGVIDRIVRLPDGRLALQEYKTTSRDFAPGADYWVRLHMDPQLSLYVIAARELGYDVQTILYDVTRRPALRPLKATPPESRKFTKDGRLYANQRDLDETPEEYAARIVADIASRPEHYFARIEIARLDSDLEEARAELWMQQMSIRAAQRLSHWYRNPGSCFQPYACEYLPICQHNDLAERTPAGFVRATEVHPELSATVGG